MSSKFVILHSTKKAGSAVEGEKSIRFSDAIKKYSDSNKQEILKFIKTIGLKQMPDGIHNWLVVNVQGQGVSGISTRLAAGTIKSDGTIVNYSVVNSEIAKINKEISTGEVGEKGEARAGEELGTPLPVETAGVDAPAPTAGVVDNTVQAVADATGATTSAVGATTTAVSNIPAGIAALIPGVATKDQPKQGKTDEDYETQPDLIKMKYAGRKPLTHYRDEGYLRSAIAMSRDIGQNGVMGKLAEGRYNGMLGVTMIDRGLQRGILWAGNHKLRALTRTAEGRVRL
jgi:hypothetical protein